MNYKRICSFVLPTVVILSACQQVSASDHLSTDSLTVSSNIENYHQIISLKNETESVNETGIPETNYTYSVTEATLFPEDTIGYGSRIEKGSALTPSKTSIYGSEEAAYQQVNSGEWFPSATVGPLYSTIEVYPYETFVKIATLFEQKGTVTETKDAYVISYYGIDEEIQRDVSEILQQFPSTGTTYDVVITLTKDNHYIQDVSFVTEVTNNEKNQTVTQEIKAAFSKHNVNVPKELNMN